MESLSTLWGLFKVEIDLRFGGCSQIPDNKRIEGCWEAKGPQLSCSNIIVFCLLLGQKIFGFDNYLLIMATTRNANIQTTAMVPIAIINFSITLLSKSEGFVGKMFVCI